MRDEYLTTHPKLISEPSLRDNFAPEDSKKKKEESDEQAPIPLGKKGTAEFGLELLNYKAGLLSKTVLKPEETRGFMWTYDFAEKAYKNGAPSLLGGVITFLAGRMSELGEGNKAMQLIETYKFTLEQDIRASNAAAQKKEGVLGS